MTLTLLKLSNDIHYTGNQLKANVSGGNIFLQVANYINVGFNVTVIIFKLNIINYLAILSVAIQFQWML